jgi:predicted MFS family arabinose efflux permease
VYSSLSWLALGAFAIGTEGFMISGILPGMARDLSVSVAAAGQLVTIFSFAYAIGSPLIAVATATVPRRTLLGGAMGVFILANLLAAWAPDYGTLAFARVLLALSAGTFMPASGAYASMTIAPERRGRALAFIYSGMTTALVLGVPLGTLLAARLDWRATFLGVAILGAVALAGIVIKLKPAPVPPAIGLSQRFAVARRSDVLGILLLTVMVVTGAFLVNTYFGAFLETVFNVSPAGVASFLFAVGVAAAGGNTLGGYMIIDNP